MHRSNHNSDSVTEESVLQKEVAAVGQIAIIPSLLNVVCRTTGMGFAAVARVTEERWIICNVNDHISFGLKPGDELKVETTICHEIRQSHELVVIDNVKEDKQFCNHPTPLMYGFQSYISVPIIKKDGTFFGTLCSIDPNPARLNTPEIIDMFRLFAELISFQLQAVDDMSEQKLISDKFEKQVAERTDELRKQNIRLETMNTDLESFAYVASHDLQEPLRKIQTYINLITQKESEGLSENAERYFARIIVSASRMRTLIDDLFSYTKLTKDEHDFQFTDLTELMDEVLIDHREETEQKKAQINYKGLGKEKIIRFQLYQVFENLISNSLKYARENVPPVINIESEIKHSEDINDLQHEKILEKGLYCHISFSDNGIGFDPQYANHVFKVFQRLHGKGEYAGTGIGLAIVKRVIDFHNGIINVSSEPGAGTTFNIYIPHHTSA